MELQGPAREQSPNQERRLSEGLHGTAALWWLILYRDGHFLVDELLQSWHIGDACG